MRKMVSAQTLTQARLNAQIFAAHNPLQLFRSTRSMLSGGVLSRGTGSSIEFQDQRPYFVGDDPRNLNWSAYARTNQLIMKVFRDERAPLIDLLIDCSASSWLGDAKIIRILELTFLAISSAERSQAPMQIWFLGSDERTIAERIEKDALEERLTTLQEPNVVFPQNASCLQEIPFRAHSTRVFITDGLYSVDPSKFLLPLAQQAQEALVLMPYADSERRLKVGELVELVNCESPQEKRLIAIDAQTSEEYQKNYMAHHTAWEEACARLHIRLQRIAVDCTLPEAFSQRLTEARQQEEQVSE